MRAYLRKFIYKIIEAKCSETKKSLVANYGDTANLATTLFIIDLDKNHSKEDVNICSSSQHLGFRYQKQI